jgi:hypothetical protein
MSSAVAATHYSATKSLLLIRTTLYYLGMHVLCCSVEANELPSIVEASANVGIQHEWLSQLVCTLA